MLIPLKPDDLTVPAKSLFAIFLNEYIFFLLSVAKKVMYCSHVEATTDVLKLTHHSQLGQIPSNDKREDFQWNRAGQYVRVQLPVTVKSQNYP
jgi:hypothetical protein